MKSKEATAGLSEGQLAEASEEGLGSKGAVVPMMMMTMMMMNNFLKFIFGIKLYMFGTVPLSIIRNFSLYTQQWYVIQVC